MTAVEHFAYGWITPALAFVPALLGCMLGNFLANRSRASNGASRARWLTLSAIAIGGAGGWVPHFMAMLGFDVPNSVVRYDVTITAIGFGLAVVVQCLGLYLVGFGRPTAWKIIPAGVLTGLGMTAAYCTGLLALRVAGTVHYDPRVLCVAAGVSIVGSAVTLWCLCVVEGSRGMLFAAVIMALAACTSHYTTVAAVRVQLSATPVEVAGVSAFTLLTPVCVLACVLLSALAYSTVGFSVRQNTASEEALLSRARDMYTVAALARARRADAGTSHRA